MAGHLSTRHRRTPGRADGTSRLLVPALVFVALVVAAVGSLGAPLITSVATTMHVSLASAQWTLTAPLLSGAVATPLLGRLGSGPRRRATIIGTLAAATVGSVLAVLPAPFAVLLAGRSLQGMGLGLTALMMGVARDHLPAPRSASVIALVSVASTIGIGVGYPLAGLLTMAGGVRAAYGLGLFVTAVALAAAVMTMPAAPGGRSARLDVAGAVLLALSLLALLLVMSETSVALARANLFEVLAAMAILGFGVGGFSAAMPGVILAATPAGETSSAMSFNQVVRSIGFAAGSAAGGLVLAAGTPAGHLSPSDGAYTTAAWIGAAVMAATALATLAGGQSVSPRKRPAPPGLGAQGGRGEEVAGEEEGRQEELEDERPGGRGGRRVAERQAAHSGDDRREERDGADAAQQDAHDPVDQPRRRGAHAGVDAALGHRVDRRGAGGPQGRRDESWAAEHAEHRPAPAVQRSRGHQEGQRER
jgi:predicted MFS family arabinose efflux permease